jgi:hypothetical protein
VVVVVVDADCFPTEEQTGARLTETHCSEKAINFGSKKKAKTFFFYIEEAYCVIL